MTFLRAELGEIMRSPAWRTQRSLAIITFDEDGYDYQRPAQRVATIMIGSAGVRQGYVSRVRYTHYSLLRTIEGALGTGTLTANDRYAQPVNDVFLPGEALPGEALPGEALPVQPVPAATSTTTAAAAGAGAAAVRTSARPAGDGVAASAEAADRVRGELGVGLGDAGQPGHPAR